MRNGRAGWVLLIAGLILLVLSFCVALLFFVGVLPMVSYPGLVEVLGEILGPIVEVVVRIVALAVMVWIGSSLTCRGVQMLSTKEEPSPFQ